MKREYREAAKLAKEYNDKIIELVKEFNYKMKELCRDEYIIPISTDFNYVYPYFRVKHFTLKPPYSSEHENDGTQYKTIEVYGNKITECCSVESNNGD